jgi:hypothetical protein
MMAAIAVDSYISSSTGILSCAIESDAGLGLDESEWLSPIAPASRENDPSPTSLPDVDVWTSALLSVNLTSPQGDIHFRGNVVEIYRQ